MLMAKASKADLEAMADFFRHLEPAVEQGFYYTRGDDERLAQFVRDHWPRISTSSTRVVFGCDILIDNVCDPAVGHLQIRRDGVEWAKKELAEIAADNVGC